ncbi:fungal specific transcription factor domain-containing protein [Aspergillus melleus]|uniref:fungal specific transcription factor domain-containing protein n=1 Tax=Aspergillus melleus TaxID=138277 RepID=UPI001E8EEA31|nr:uncharacterized protein LDX57_004401 [Aspergillus melleus]KAH8426667.1 hypothetical protein LDX57_004401 [Aspergillus melleus]
MRAFSDSESIWSLCGVAVRMAHRIGLHRDGSQHGLSVFDTEMRRRLWLQLIILDATTAQSSGITAQTSLMRADVRRPSNVNDSDLDPCMTESPREHDGATEMIFCLVRNEFGEWLERWYTVSKYSNGIWGFLNSPSLTLAKKDEAINELSDALESKFLRHCDRSIPLHLMASFVVQTIICHMRLAAHHPRQYSNGENVDQKERDYMFSLCLQIVENSVAAQTNTIIQRYAWHIENHVPWDACIHMLYELGHRVNDKETGRAWCLLDEIYRYHYWQMKNRPKNSFYIAMRRLLVKAWNAHTEERIRQNKSTLPRPWIISKLCPGTNTQGVGDSRIASSSPPNSAAQEVVQGSEPTQDAPLGVTQAIDFGGDIEDLELSPMDWGQWDDLLQQFTNSDAWGE